MRPRKTHTLKSLKSKSIKQKTMEMNYKPFDLDAAKAGAPVVTRDGRPARIIYSEAKSIYNIIALVEDGGDERPISVATDGVNGLGPSNNDLFMVSVKREGWVNLYKSEDCAAMVGNRFIYKTKHEAYNMIGTDANVKYYIATIKIEWEE